MRDFRNVRAGLLVSVAIVAFGAATPVFGGDPARFAANLPEEALASPHSYYHFQGVTQREAEALFGSAIAAVYHRDSGEVELLADDHLATAREWIAWRASRGDEEAARVSALADSAFESNLKSTAQMSLQSFMNRIESFEETKAGEATGGEYLVKFPSHKPAHTLPPTTYAAKRKAVVKSEKDYFYIYDDFEGDTWSVWSRSDNTGGQYTWGVRSCDSYWGSYSADAPRGGSQGALLDCSSAYPTSIDAYMSFEACQSVAANWKAFLEFEYSGFIDKDGDDSFAVYFEDLGGSRWGWAFWGNWSEWYQLVFNLRQWYKIGDLGASYCNTLSLNFESDGIANTGFGARVDDLYVYYGDTTGSYECGIIADPQSGDAPLTVAFRATTDMYDPDVYWRFGDGGTAEERDPAYVYSAPGTYRASVGTYDYGTACYASTTITVTQGACTYSISPTSASYGHTGGSGNINVSVNSGCAWSASTSRSWIDITSGSSGSGSGTVSYTLDANTSTSQRSGTIQVAGKTFAVTQSGAPACTYSISPSAASIQSNGGSLSTSVSANSGCSWSATSGESWISVTGGASGSGDGTVSLHVDSNPSSSTRAGTVEIADTTFSVTQYGASQPPAGDHTYYAVVAHTTGENNSMWTSSLSLCSFSSAPSGVTLTYRYGHSSSVVRNVTIPAYGILEYDDVTVGLFNVGGKSSGVVTIESSTPIMAAVRTYNSGDNGTFGQSLPGVASSMSITESQTGILSPVRRSPLFRTNVGFINTGSTSCTVRLTFRDGNGSQIGSAVTRGLAPGAWTQINEAIAAAGVGYAEGAYAVVEVMTPGAEVWAYATVIDNSSGDPTALRLEVVQ